MLLPKPRSIHPPPDIWAQKYQMFLALVSPSTEHLLYSNVWQRTAHGAPVAEVLSALLSLLWMWVNVLLIFVPRLPQALSLGLTLTVVWDFLFCIFLPLWLLCLPHDLPSGPKEQIKWEIVLKTSQFTSPRWGKCHCSGDQCLIPLQLLRSAFWALERFFPHTGEKMLMDIFIEGRLGKAICLLSFQNILFSFSFAVPPNVTSFLTCSSNHLLQL